MKKRNIIISLILLSFLLIQCTPSAKKEKMHPKSKIEKLLLNYADVKLVSDLSYLTENQKEMIPLLIEAAKIIDELFWIQTCNKKDEVLNSITDKQTKKYFKINYGPWDK